MKADPLTLRSIAGFVNFRDGFIFAIGGDSTSNSVDRYDIAFDSWSNVAPLNRSTNHATSNCALGAYIYSAGGWDEFNNTNRSQSRFIVERLNAKL